MQDILFFTVKKFLHEHIDYKKPLLLAFSGGSDSMVLLHLLLRCKEEKDFSLHLAHIDHGWRKTSAREAKELEKLAKKYHLVFHTVRQKEMKASNQEDQARIFRLQYFQKLWQKYCYQAIFFAHHADDRAETVLKRIFEGAHLQSLKGMQEVASYENLLLWRPLLGISKKKILAYAKKHSLSFIDDITNHTDQYLRGRLRHQVLPFLSKMFHKEISLNLYELGERSQELERYFDKKIEKALLLCQTKSFSLFIPERAHENLEPIEKKYFLKTLLQRQNLDISRDILQRLFSSLEKSKNHRYFVKKGYIYTDRKQLFMMQKDIEALMQQHKPQPLQEGKNIFGPWIITLEAFTPSFIAKKGWQNLWQEGITFSLPHKNFIVASGFSEGEYILPKLKKIYEKRICSCFFTKSASGLNR